MPNRMTPYANNGGDSNVVAYSIDDTGITVQFADGSKYLYTDSSAGSAVVSEMQRLAQLGRGLNSYITRVVRTKYARKW